VEQQDIGTPRQRFAGGLRVGAGLAAATVVWLLRAPMLVAVLVGVVATALLRLAPG